MIISSSFVTYNQVLFPGRRQSSSKFPVVEVNQSPVHCEIKRYGRESIITAASSSFISSGSENSEPLSAVQKKKGRRIVGIDQDELVDPTVLADPDSCFCEFQGLQLHHKICDPESDAQDLLHDVATSDLSSRMEKLKFPLILLHGFGASLFSWNEVMKPLAKIAGTKVLSFDRPAFGLTSRVDNPHKRTSTNGGQDTKPVNPYSMAFSVMVTLYFIDFLASDKAILVGHSAGCLVAAQTYFQAPERVAAMILVAPAIIAPLTTSKKVKEKDQQDNSNSEKPKNPIFSFLSIFSKLSRFIAQTVMHLLRGMANMVDSLYKKTLSAFLRSPIALTLVRTVIDKFGITAIKNACRYEQRVGIRHLWNSQQRCLLVQCLNQNHHCLKD
ncbi:uncharacterized protein [Rutidosis leptorrhynchoides]|uniref:uncharacterized protein isoform X2 n=1 Tax=Rutidosis leptorrhynchoides TaxID=125765 RepID=UPI003A99DAF5